jgi:histidinol-phosphate phosphatase family protein
MIKFALIIFDADGTLRHCTAPGQLVPTAPGEWELLPGVKEVLAKVIWGSPRHDGTAIGVASNQSWIAKGRISEGEAWELLADMVQKATGLLPPEWAIELCPHLATDNCKCRKPKPTMLRNLMDKWGVEANATLFVGDLPTDQEAAARAGCWFAWADKFFGRNDGDA